MKVLNFKIRGLSGINFICMCVFLGNKWILWERFVVGVRLWFFYI